MWVTMSWPGWKSISVFEESSRWQTHSPRPWDRPEVETGQLELSATRLDILNIENQLDQGLAFLLARRCRMKKDGQAAVMRPELYDAIFVSLVSGEAKKGNNLSGSFFVEITIRLIGRVMRVLVNLVAAM